MRSESVLESIPTIRWKHTFGVNHRLQTKDGGEMLGRLWQSAAIKPRVNGRYEEYVDTGHLGGRYCRPENRSI